MSDAKPKYVGRSVLRKEDGPLLRGQGRFAADINFPNQLHMRVVRSTFAHGKLLSVDLKPALAIPGVHAAWSFADVADIPPIDFRLTKLASLAAYRQTILVCDRVR
ncbi:MAG: xanthine dehydrogenase, partial [Tardiphaga sp.]|nr:xanthine dehydrogenase [Tardiphaga sp.]